jgi:DNA-binding CsgD family transcriptional regulator
MSIPVETANLLKSLFAAALAPAPFARHEDPWQTFLLQLCAATHAHSATLILDGGRGAGRIWLTGPKPLLGPEHVPAMRHDRVYSQIDLPGIPAGAAPLRAVKSALGPGEAAVLGIQSQGRDFRAVDAVPLTSLAPFLGQALQSWRALAEDRARADLHTDLTRNLGAGVIVFTATGLIAEISDVARARLKTASDIRLLPQGRLDLASGDKAQALRDAIAATLRPRAKTVALELSTDPPLGLMLAPGHWAGQPAAIGYLRQTIDASALPPAIWARTLGLRQSEARLAALLCDGASLTEAAARLGWTIETARSCSKQIFARTGVTGQSALIRKMLTSPVWLANAGANEKPSREKGRRILRPLSHPVPSDQ